jgi:hypothetical protein
MTRPTKPACGTCLFFEPGPLADHGYCRRFPRTLEPPGGRFGQVAAFEWCGEWIHRISRQNAVSQPKEAPPEARGRRTRKQRLEILEAAQDDPGPITANIVWGYP